MDADSPLRRATLRWDAYFATPADRAFPNSSSCGNGSGRSRRVRSTSSSRLAVTLWFALASLASLPGCAGHPRQTYSNWHLPPDALGNFQGLSQVDTPPRFLRGRAPVYPISQITRGPGSATVAFTIDEDGHTRNLEVLEASYPYFGSHMMIAIRDWRFEPARKDGHPVPVRTKITFNFIPPD